MSQSTLTRAQPRRVAVSRKAVARSFRPDIQGLRAVAVLAVVADHLYGYPAGGFVGVDVFFVISGFLITGLLLREHEKKGRISFGDFYRRRIRRILPVAIVVLGVTVAVSWTLFSPVRAKDTSRDAFFALIFGANWQQAAIGTDYMQANGPVSPLQHFWSLAVEEQFYVVWPWLIVLVLGVLARRLSLSSAVARRVLAVVFLLVILSTFAYAMWETSARPTVAYFSTISRTWELAIGALLALVGGVFAKLNLGLRTVLGYLGLAGIAWSIWSITAEMAFPGPWAAVPVLATAMVIAAGSGGEQRYLYPLTNPVAKYLGNISYSLYLWHFPIIIVVGSLFDPESVVVSGGILAGMFGLAALSYHFIEDPIRRSAWLEPGRQKGMQSSLRTQMTLVSALALVTVVVAALALIPKTAPVPTSAALAVLAPSTSAPSASVSPTVASGPEGELAAQISDAVKAKDWPELTPSLESLPGAFAPEWIDDGCLNVSDSNLQKCVYGDPNADKTVVLLGDSVGVSWMPGLRDALVPDGWKIQVATMGQCPAIDLPVTKGAGPDPQFTERCAEHQKWAMGVVADINPDMVILASALNTPWRIVGAEGNPNVLGDWTEGTISRLIELKTITQAQIVLLSSPAETENLSSCATRFSHPADCLRKEPRYEPYLASEKRAAEAVEGVRYVSPRDWICTKSGKCPVFAGDTPIYVDANHLTPAFSKKLAPLLRSSILGAA